MSDSYTGNSPDPLPGEQALQTQVDDATPAAASLANVEVDELGIGKTPVGTASAYTKTYNTAARVIPAATAVAVTQTGVAAATTGATTTTPAGYTTTAQADAIRVGVNACIVDIAALVVENAQLAADVLALRKLIVAIVDDLEGVGVSG